jgi:hypothetical protein
VALRRVGQRWYLDEPAHARAHEAGVLQLIDAIVGLGVHRFVDNPDSFAVEELGFSEPAMLIVAETDRRIVQADGQVRELTEHKELRVGGAASVSGDVLYATPDGGQTVFVVGAETLGEISPGFAGLVARTSTGILAADIGMVVVTTETGDALYSRTLTGWTRLEPTGEQTLIDEADMDELLATLTRATCVDASLAGPSGYEPMGEVRLMGLGSESLQTIRFGLTDAALVLSAVDVPADGTAVHRSYPLDETPSLLMLSVVAGIDE